MTTTVNNNLTCGRKGKFDRKSANFLMKYLFVKRQFFMANADAGAGSGSQISLFDKSLVNNADVRGVKRGACESCDCEIFQLAGEGITTYGNCVNLLLILIIVILTKMI